MNYLDEIGAKAKKAATKLNILGQTRKNEGLTEAANALIGNETIILEANQIDIDNARQNGIKESLIDRLQLNHDRILGMAQGLLDIVALPDPVGEVLSMTNRPNGLIIGQKRVPIGVVGIIYESRPNVTADAFGLCFKTGNAVILRGVDIIKAALQKLGLPEDAIQLITKTDRETAKEMMRLNKYIDVLIPRGGAGLIQTVVDNSTVPVIETGTGNCHVYVDEYADFDMALDIIENATDGTCNRRRFWERIFGFLYFLKSCRFY
ncbi:MAG: glutamate-5-semialdehyde dehydrogenase [Anaerocolumna sp.]|nr:glutamate-5-semialdehyde dehydrogenase [Anaerocolumna sp.]